MLLTYQMLNKRTNQIVGSQVTMANTFFSRLKGLMGQKGLTLGKGLWLSPCRQIHTFGMKFNISVCFIDKEGNVIAIHDDMQPGHVSPVYKKAQSVIEFSSHWAALNDTVPGDVLEWKRI